MKTETKTIEMIEVIAELNEQLWSIDFEDNETPTLFFTTDGAYWWKVELEFQIIASSEEWNYSTFKEYILDSIEGYKQSLSNINLK